ncbi:MAG: hypothetical protein WBL25_16700, partial [Anaerolineales bacterium]
ATLLGMGMPPMPPGVNQATLMIYSLLGSFILAGALGFVSLRLSGGFLTRWLILAFLTWIVYGVNTYLEAAIFTTMTGPAIVIMYLVSSVLCAAAMSALFRPKEQGEGFLVRMKSFFAGRSVPEWGWRFLLAFLAFPVAYIVFGLMVQPFTYEFYVQQQMGLTAPGWDQILPVLALRSFLFLLAVLPVLVTWKLSRKSLFITLGIALFLLVGGLSMISAIWYTPVVRIAHSLEILADSFVHAGALVYLLVKHK